ncbi:AraC family transcriptional regulator [Neobacillus massiliamazoniensis]|uniref:AraC family transcriptional regulator n=1 Tax=Neobacillus massiliamazoniensis TaxID=1499688 RepID=A0A0U1NVQ0_9BACI|nr:AraC family transcriptional regulator [Neobacillus massiliamazoniensis]CRK82110.1 AraC family transcriptional regulator [Neobacillus massiliamazoniensis]
MGWVESLQKAIDYIEEHLLENITIENIAKQANVSPFHFQRTFSILTDISIGEYIRRRRLSLAAQELAHTSSKIIEIALKYGYDTPEAFTKAFRRQHGITPSQVRNYSGMLNSYNRLMIQVSLKGAEPMKYKVLEKESFQVVGVKREFSGANGENLSGIPKMWDDVHADGTNDLLVSLNNGEIKGVLGVCVGKPNTQPQLIDYWIATDFKGDVPEGLLQLEIPAAKWGVFEVHGAMPDAMQKAWKQIFSEWFPSSHYEHAGSPELEVYSDGDPWSPDYYSEIWIPVK